MKNNKLRLKPYKNLIYKVFLQTLGITVLAVVVVAATRIMGRGEFGNFITNTISRIMGVDWNTARFIYLDHIRSNLDAILAITTVILFLLFFRILLSWFTRYFDEIIEGINQLATGKQQIRLSPELNFVEDKLNLIKDELERSVAGEREAEQRKNELVVYLAHDIKTPLTSVIGYLNLLEENPDMSLEKKAKYVQITLEKAYRLEKLINEFFEITRYNLRSIPLEKESINLEYMLIQIADEAYPQLITANKQVSVKIPENLRVNADSDKIARVFNNLLKNAISYSENNSTIEISGHRKEGDVIISFKNTGTIPENKMGFIFEKFYRLDEARQTATGGSGLGLAISKDIVTLHEGTITASCENNTTTFKVILPN